MPRLTLATVRLHAQVTGHKPLRAYLHEMGFVLRSEHKCVGSWVHAECTVLTSTGTALASG